MSDEESLFGLLKELYVYLTHARRKTEKVSNEAIGGEVTGNRR